MSSDYAAAFNQFGRNRLAKLRELIKREQVLDQRLLLQVYELLDQVLETAFAWTETAEFLILFATQAERQVVLGEWESLLVRGVDKAEAVADVATQGLLLYYLGVLYGTQGRFEPAIEALQQSVTCFQEAQDEAAQAKAWGQVAFLAQKNGQDEVAKRAIEHAKEVRATINEQAQILSVQGILAQKAGEHEASKQHFIAALFSYERGGDKRLIAMGLLNLGTAHRRLDEMNEAQICYQRAIELGEEVGDPRVVAIANTNMGNLHLVSGRFKEALKWFIKPEWFYKEINDTWSLSNLYNSRGMACRGVKEFHAGTLAYEEALRLRRPFNHAADMINILDNFALLLRDAEKPMAARERLDEAYPLLPDVADTARRAKLRKMLDETAASLGFVDAA